MSDVLERVVLLLPLFSPGRQGGGSGGGGGGGGGGPPPPGLRDVLRWCGRCQLFPGSNRGDDRRSVLFREALAAFCLPLADGAERRRRADALAQVLQVGRRHHFNFPKKCKK